MALDMRALYYVTFNLKDDMNLSENIKANENFLNQNFNILAEKVYELEERIAMLEQE